MEYRHVSASEKRRRDLLQHSTEALAGMPHSYGAQSFILSEGEAIEIGEAIHVRDHRTIYDVVSPLLDAASQDYAATEASEYLKPWNDSLQTIFGEGIVLQDLLATDDTRELFNTVLADSESTQLGLDTSEYLKLLETVAVATMPEAGIHSFPTSKRSRSGGSQSALFYRSISVLTSIASAAPGIRSVREGVLNTDANVLNKHVSSMIRTHSAQTSLATLLEMEPNDIRRQKAGLERIFNDTQTERDLEIDDMMHILEWRMLVGNDEDRDARHTRIRRIIEGQSQTECQRRKLHNDWCPERLDFLIEIAEMAKNEGRNPTMYISNRFEEGAGVYVSVELDNPNDPNQKILFADNPLAGNALYIVDEARLENEGRPDSWQRVLGSNRRIARERGAIRKYHTKNWQDILPTIMLMGERTAAEAPQATAPEVVLASAEVTPTAPLSESELIERSIALQQRIQKLVAGVYEAIDASS